MTEVIYCENCHTKQPNDWQQGDLCIECGSSVRADVRCVWCADLTPSSGNFCKHCGTEVMEDKYFGPARILKSLGVSQLELPAKVKELTDVKLSQHQQTYNKHYKVIQFCKEQAYMLEPYLLVKGDNAVMRVENDMISQIPFPDNTLKTFDELLKKDITVEKLLQDPLNNSLSSTVFKLAEIANNREYPYNFHPYWCKRVLYEVADPEFPVRMEMALWLSHPNSFDHRFSWEPIRTNDCTKLKDRKTSLDVFLDVLLPVLDIAYLKPYAGVALVHLLNKLEMSNHAQYDYFTQIAKEALDHHDPDLVLGAALLFNDKEKIILVSKMDKPACYNAYSWLLTDNSDSYEKILTDSKFNEHQLIALIDFVKQDDINFQNEHGKNVIGVYPDAFTQAANALIREWGNTTLFGKLFSTYSDDKINSYLNYAARFSTPTQEEWDTLIHFCKNRDDREGLTKILSNRVKKDINYTEAAKMFFDVPQCYSDEEKGYEFIASWLPVVESGYYPDAKVIQKLINFLRFTQTFLQYRAFEKVFVQKIFEVFRLLIVYSETASVPLSKYIIHASLDIRDYINADYFGHKAYLYGLFRETYVAKSSEDGNYYSYPFQIDKDFIRNFFDDDNQKLINSFVNILPVGAGYGNNAFDLMSNWILKNPYGLPTSVIEGKKVDFTLGYKILDAFKESMKFIKEQGKEILNMQANGSYPFLNLLHHRQWDGNDVFLFYHKTDEADGITIQKCYDRFVEWLTRDNSVNFYTEVMEKYGKHCLTFNDTKKMPLSLLKLWYNQADTNTMPTEIVEFYNEQFSILLREEYRKELPIMQHKGIGYHISFYYVTEKLFKGEEEFSKWFMSHYGNGLNDPLVRFVLLGLNHAPHSLKNYIAEERRLQIHRALIYLADNAYKADTYIQETYIRIIYNLLINLNEGTDDIDIIVDIWGLKDIHYSLAEECDEYAEKIFIGNENDPLTKEQLPNLYNYLSDYYYSSGKDVKWVSSVLNIHHNRVIDYFNNCEEDSSIVLTKIFELLVRFMDKDGLLPEGESVQKKICKDISAHIAKLIEGIDNDKFPKPLVKYLYEYVTSGKLDFFLQAKIENYIEKLYEYHFDEEEEDDEDIYTNTVITSSTKKTVNTAEAMAAQSSLVAELSTFMATFTVTRENMQKVTQYINGYKDSDTDNPMIITPLTMKIEESRNWLAENTDVAMELYQAIYMTILDIDTEMGARYSNFGAMCRMVFGQLVKNTMFASSYQQGLEAMANSGAYSEIFTDGLKQVANELKG